MSRHEKVRITADDKLFATHNWHIATNWDCRGRWNVVDIGMWLGL